VTSPMYQAFLATKRRSVAPVGKPVDVADVHPTLHDWQREIVAWAGQRGRAAIFADCGLGKTFMQLEWLRIMAGDGGGLIVAPLSVARQTVREAEKLGVDLAYVRDGGSGPGLRITNYEMVDKVDPTNLAAVVLDESSILKNVDGTTRQRLTKMFEPVPYRLACTATPAPNDVAELCNHAEWLGIMRRADMLAAYFVHDEVGWRIKGHAVDPMHRWMAGWACAVRTPADLGYPDDGYDLPEMTITPEVLDVDVEAEGQLFAVDLGGVGGRAKIRKATLEARVERAASLASEPGQWIIWCGLNDEADAVTKLVDGAVNVSGSWSPDQKAEALEGFQDGSIRVLVTKPSIAGFGMNFQNAARMAFVGLSDSYESYYQAIRRCYRFGQQRPVEAHVIVSALEQQIVANVRRKETEAARSIEFLVNHCTLEKAS